MQPQHTRELLPSLSDGQLIQILERLPIGELPADQQDAIKGLAAREAITALIDLQARAGEVQVLGGAVSTLVQEAARLIEATGNKGTIEATHHHEGRLGRTEIKVSNTRRSKIGCLVFVGLGLLPFSLLI